MSVPFPPFPVLPNVGSADGGTHKTWIPAFAGRLHKPIGRWGPVWVVCGPYPAAARDRRPAMTSRTAQTRMAGIPIAAENTKSQA